MVGDRHGERVPRARARLALGEQLADVAHLGGEGLGARRPLRVVARAACAYSFIAEPQPAALTADRVDVLEAPRSSPAPARAPGRRRRRAAAARRSSPARRGACDLAALGREHARGGRVDVAEEHALHAALQQRDAAARARRAAGVQLAAAARGRGARRGVGRQRGQRPQQPGGTRAPPSRAPSGQQRARSARSRRGCGNSAKISRGAAAARAAERSCRALDLRRGSCSISRSYCTPDGQAVTHAMQPRQRSKCGDRLVVERARPPRAPASSGRCARAASPSPRPTARRSGRSAGRSRSARSRRCSSGVRRAVSSKAPPDGRGDVH